MVSFKNLLVIFFLYHSGLKLLINLMGLFSLSLSLIGLFNIHIDGVIISVSFILNL